MDSLSRTTSTLVSSRRAAVLLGIPRTKVAALIYTGLLPARVVGHTHCIALSDLERVRLQHPHLFPAAE